MPDSSISIDYTITAVTPNSQTALSLVAYTLSNTETQLSQNRSDNFRTDLLAANVQTSSSDTSAKLTQLKTNFEALASVYIRSFAAQVRTAESQIDVSELVQSGGTVTGLSMDNRFGANPVARGTVVVSLS